MSPFTTLLRLIFIPIFLSMPFVITGALLAGTSGVICGGVIGLLGMILIAAYSEHGIAKAYHAEKPIPQGLMRTLQFIDEEGSEPTPHLLVYSDPTPNVFTVRSFGGKGTVLLSQGLVALLNEEELRAILRMCLYRVRKTPLVFQSFCAQLTIWSLASAPQVWVDLVFSGRTLSKEEERLLSPLSTVGFLISFHNCSFSYTRFTY